ncbi:unnamed protein product [Chironomus riparius]|uniref:GRIP domain-containing protein n=1 Tax=Chironomus riparius TaxID=315576 RepID=A0A9N9RWF4_9DIPT|nr:unnamed protein product [Chironomus riparius]
MDENKNSHSTANQEKKSSSFDELSREELITKCNKLLLIARKAKNSKDELFEENKQIKEELDKLKQQNEVIQEVVENLTQNKLASANQIEEANKQISKRDVSIRQLQTKNDEVTIENESLKRQLQRLTDENESLIEDMQSIESKTSKCDNDEENEKINKLNEEILSLRTQYEEKCKEISSLKEVIDNKSIKIKNVIQENSELKTSIESSNTPSDEIKVRYEKVLKKLKAYREKLFEVYEQAKLIKAEKSVLLSLTKEYGDYVANWQKDIANASTRLVIQLKELNLEIKNKNEEIKKLEEALEAAKVQNSNEKEIGEMKQQIETLNETIKAKDKLLDEEKEAQKKLKQSMKKPSVLDLEIEAFEKTLDETNKKLETKKKQVVELEDTISIQNETINSFKSQIASLEENLESEKAHSVDIKKNLDNQLNLLRKTEHERTESNLQYDLLTKNYESLKLENNEVKLEMAKTVGEMEKRYQSLESERNELLKNISFLESEVEKFKKLSSAHEKEIEDIRSEFVSYKVRAQSVLRQNQTKDLGKEHELQDEVVILKTSLENFKESNHKINSELEALKKNYNSLVEDKTRLQGRCKDLLSTLEKQSEEVLDESRKRNQEHDESIKAYQLQIDTLNTFYKKRIQDLEESKQNSILELQDKISILERNSAQNASMTSSSEAVLIPKTDDQKLSNMLDLMDREVEGSEDQSSQSMTYSHFHNKRKISRGRDLIPLDELLNSSFDDNYNEMNEETISNYSSPSELLEQTKTRLQKEESRVVHLTTLLADSEKDLARMQQLNEMLKEEVRRHQRSIEREQHIQNSEYLKNIIIKFVTLNNGDEKQRLIPVLNTILKLSSDELQVLQNSCKSGWALWTK